MTAAVVFWRTGDRRRRARLVLFPTVGILVLAACGTDARRDDPAGVPRPSAPIASEIGAPQPTSDASTTDAGGEPQDSGGPPVPRSTARQTAHPSSGEWDLVLTDVRVAGHERFDRIVLEFRGKGLPGWAVSYVDEAVLDGTGEVVALGGDATLDIYASGTTWPGSGYYDGPNRIQADGSGQVDEAYVGGTFEGYTQVLVAVGGRPAPFRVFALTGPSRLVVDVAAEGAE